MRDSNGRRRELSLQHFFKILDVIAEVRREIGDPDMTMEDVIVQYSIEERVSFEHVPGKSLGQRFEEAMVAA